MCVSYYHTVSKYCYSLFVWRVKRITVVTTHRHFVAAWMPVRIPYEANAKTNLFSRKRDAVDVVPYRIAIVVMSHIPRTLFVHVIWINKCYCVSVALRKINFVFYKHHVRGIGETKSPVSCYIQGCLHSFFSIFFAVSCGVTTPHIWLKVYILNGRL